MRRDGYNTVNTLNENMQCFGGEKTSEDEFSDSDTETCRQQAAAKKNNFLLQKQAASNKLLGITPLREAPRTSEPITDEETTPPMETAPYDELLTIHTAQSSRCATTTDDSTNSVYKFKSYYVSNW